MSQQTISRQTAPPAPARSRFDYDKLASSIQHSVRQEVVAIKRLIEKGASDVVQIGLRLLFVRNSIGRKDFQEWLRAEFSWSQSVASKYMCVARVFGSCDSVTGFQSSALYLLARKRVPREARQEAMRLASGGELITKASAQAIVARYCEDAVTQNSPRTDRVRQRLLSIVRNLPQAEAEAMLTELLHLVRLGP